MKTRLLFSVLVLAVILMFGRSIYAKDTTINVPEDFPTLQEAIDAAKDGDTILVAEGTYKGNIYFKGKSLNLIADDSNVTIEGTEEGSVVTIDSDSTIKGFTITSNDLDCRGIYIIDASPIIEDCTIIDNQTTASGGGVYSTDGSNPQIVNCIIIENTGANNTAQVAGGLPVITDSFIEDQGLVTSSAIIEQEEQSEQLKFSYQQGELLVRFAPVKDNRNKNRMRTSLEKTNLLDSVSRRGKKGSMTIKRNFKVIPNLSVVKLPEGMDVEEALEIFKNTEGVLYAEPNYELRAFSTFMPDDDLFEQQWGLHNEGQTGGTIDADIDAPEAWYVTG